MSYQNEMMMEFSAVNENESFARSCVAAFCSVLNPTLDEICDIKTAVSEAVTNSVVHGYPNLKGKVRISVKLEDRDVYIKIKDFGVGISDVNKARQPFYTSRPDQERSGMGFTVMEGFMDSVTVHSIPNIGTEVSLVKHLGGKQCVVEGGHSIADGGYHRAHKVSSSR